MGFAVTRSVPVNGTEEVDVVVHPDESFSIAPPLLRFEARRRFGEDRIDTSLDDFVRLPQVRPGRQRQNDGIAVGLLDRESKQFPNAPEGVVSMVSFRGGGDPGKPNWWYAAEGRSCGQGPRDDFFHDLRCSRIQGRSAGIDEVASN